MTSHNQQTCVNTNRQYRVGLGRERLLTYSKFTPYPIIFVGLEIDKDLEIGYPEQAIYAQRIDDVNVMDDA